MTEEKKKVFCVNCKHCIIQSEHRKKPQINVMALCELTKIGSIVDYVTGLDIIRMEPTKLSEYNTYYWYNLIPAKKFLGITYRKKREEKNSPIFYAKDCESCNSRGNCPTFEQYKEPVVQKETK